MKINFLSKTEWNQGVKKLNGGFLQSWGWGKLKQTLGAKVLRIAEEDARAPFRAQIIEKPLWANKSFFYCPRGPLGLKDDKKGSAYIEDFLKLLSKQAKEENICFLRTELPFESEAPRVDLPSFINKFGFLSFDKAHQPQDTLIKDISAPTEEILANFDSKTRYNIRLAQRKEVQVKKISKESEFEKFYQLLKELSQSKDFGILAKDHYKRLFQLSNKDKAGDELRVLFLGAYHEKDLIGGIFGAYFNDRGYYLHGANDYKKRSLMGSYLLQWALINELKELGAKEYDLWGVIRKENFASKQDYKQDDWYGITRFKEKFGCEKKSYPGAFDYPFQPYIYKFYSAFRKIKHDLKL